MLVKFHAVVRAVPEHATLRLYYWQTVVSPYLSAWEPTWASSGSVDLVGDRIYVTWSRVKLKLQSKKRLDESSFKWTEMEEIIFLSHF